MEPSEAFTTADGRYDVDVCAALRNVTTHGGTTPKATDVLDRAAIAALPVGLAEAVDRCWGGPAVARPRRATTRGDVP